MRRINMNKVKNITITALACFSFGGAIVAINSLTNAVPTVAAASQENIDIANRDIANYLANCQQYEWV